MEKSLTIDNIYDKKYDDYRTLQSILTNPSFNPNVILRDKGLDAPAWVWILINSNDINLIHYALSNPNIKIENINKQLVLDIAKNKDTSVYERLAKYIGPLAGFEQMSIVNQLPYGVMDIIKQYVTQKSWKDIELYNTIYSNGRDREVLSLCNYDNILCISRRAQGQYGNVYVYDLNQNLYLDRNYYIFITNMQLYKNILVGAGFDNGIYYAIININIDKTAKRYYIENDPNVKVAINDKYIIVADVIVRVFDRNTLNLIRQYTGGSVTSISLEGDILCLCSIINYVSHMDIYNLNVNYIPYKKISLPDGDIEYVCIQGDTIVGSSYIPGNETIRDLHVWKIDLNDCLNVFPYREPLRSIEQEDGSIMTIPNIHDNHINSLSFKNNIVVSCSHTEVRIWDIGTSKMLKEIKDDNIMCSLIHDNSVIYGLRDGNVKIYK